MLYDRRDFGLLRLAGTYQWLPLAPLRALSSLKHLYREAELLSTLGLLSFSRSNQYLMPSPEGYQFLASMEIDCHAPTKRPYTPEWRRQEELAKAERKARAKSRPAPSAPEAGPPPAQPANTAPATPGQKEAGGETAPHKERDQILRQEYDYGLLDPELDRVSSQSPDTEAPYGAFDLIETSPDEVGGP